MDVLAWSKVVRNLGREDERKIIETYYFINPFFNEVDKSAGGSDNIDKRIRSNECRYYKFINNFLEYSCVADIGGGFGKDNFVYLESIDLNTLADRIGLDKTQLEKIFTENT